MNPVKLQWITPEVTNLNGAKKIEGGTPSVSTTSESTVFTFAFVPDAAALAAAGAAACGGATTGTVQVPQPYICEQTGTGATGNTTWIPPDGTWTTTTGCSAGATSTGASVAFSCS